MSHQEKYLVLQVFQQMSSIWEIIELLNREDDMYSKNVLSSHNVGMVFGVMLLEANQCPRQRVW